MKDIVIREAKLTDLNEIKRIDMVAFDGLSYPYFVLRQYYDCFQQLFLVAELNQHVIGYTLGAVRNGENSGFCLSLAINNEFKGQGIGGLLIQNLIDRFELQGIPEIELTVSPNNVAAIHLYCKLGFKAKGTVKDYYGDGTERTLMTRTID